MSNSNTNKQIVRSRISSGKTSHTQFYLFLLLLAMVMITSSAIAQPAGPMVAGTYALTTSISWYDPGGAGGTICPGSSANNYSNNSNITETMTANAGQRIVVTWIGGTFGIASGDVLTVHDGPTTASPVLATYTNTSSPIPSIIGPTTSNSITFHFTSDASNTCKGWQATIAPYYFMQPGSYSFSCPGTYTFIDPQSTSSGGPGGDASCIASGGNTKDYLDVQNMIETFTTNNGQCIQVDPSFPNNFGICALDTLRAFDGPSILSPIANGGTAVYTNTFVNPASFSTLGSTLTFQFNTDANNHARGWQIALSCISCPAASINNDCVNAVVLSAGGSCNYISGSVSVTNSNANPFLVPICTGTNTANDDVWYSFAATNSTMSVTVAASDGTMDPVVQLLGGTCESFTSLYCENATGAGGTEVLDATGLTTGTTYYIRVYDAAPTNTNHTFNICVVGAANTDCSDALQVCNTSMITHTAAVYPDFGIQEYDNQYWGCDNAGEIRSAWYYIHIATSGTFGFTISALNGSTYMDNDFVLWGPLPGLSCPMTTTPKRCSAAIAYASNAYGLPPYSTGLESAESDLSEGASGNAFVQTVGAVAGEWYVLMVNIYTGPPSYNITWMDNIPSNQQATFAVNEAIITAAGPTTFCKTDSVELTEANPESTYQWKKGNNIIAGATQQTFTATKGGNYKCVVSNNCGSATSNTITVTVNPRPTVSVSQAPCNNSAVLLTCTSNPNTGVTYKWRKNGSPISGATNPTYSATESATYKCIVTITASGCTKSTAGINVSVTCKTGESYNVSNVIVYPNPTSDYFNISTSQLDLQSEVCIYDLTGRKVESHAVTGYEMQVGESLANGVYFLKIVTNNETQQVIKLVKNF